MENNQCIIPFQSNIFHPFNTEKKQFMEYVDDHGTWADIPVADIYIGWKKIYGEDRVRRWIEGYEQAGASGGGDFDREEAV